MPQPRHLQMHWARACVAFQDRAWNAVHATLYDSGNLTLMGMHPGGSDKATKALSLTLHIPGAGMRDFVDKFKGLKKSYISEVQELQAQVTDELLYKSHCAEIVSAAFAPTDIGIAARQFTGPDCLVRLSLTTSANTLKFTDPLKRALFIGDADAPDGATTPKKACSAIGKLLSPDDPANTARDMIYKSFAAGAQCTSAFDDALVEAMFEGLGAEDTSEFPEVLEAIKKGKIRSLGAMAGVLRAAFLGAVALSIMADGPGQCQDLVEGWSADGRPIACALYRTAQAAAREGQPQGEHAVLAGAPLGGVDGAARAPGAGSSRALAPPLAAGPRPDRGARERHVWEAVCLVREKFRLVPRAAVVHHSVLPRLRRPGSHCCARGRRQGHGRVLSC
ncbi:unnamed protein product [Prorocentrum cordatum]|uniref:Uncharacterized protein n=1 Tax=Prorocentrum cordatum TaxID=2364126 RepID=A0ABN9SXU1_9DINO|nr:unnamed protein product [Polarella glacialis]